MKKIILAVALSLGIAGTAVAAEGPLSYDFAQLSAVHTHEGSPSNGVDAKVSFNLVDGFFVQGDAQRLQLNGAFASRYQAGLGYHYSLSSNVSAYALASAVAVNTNATGSSHYGYDGEVGLRWAVAPSLELSGAVESQSLNLQHGVRNQVENFGKVGASYFLTKDLAVTADFRGSKIDHQVGAGVRYTW